MGKMKTSFVGEESDKNKKKHDQAHKGEAEKVHMAGLKGGQRVKMVDSPAEVSTKAGADTEESHSAKASRDAREPKIRSRKYQEAKAKIDREKLYKAADAVKLAKDASYSKFDGTMELHLVMKKVGTSAQVTLPHMAGREKKVEIADDVTIEKLKEGKIDYDILIATPEMMPKLVPFARLLGPKGLMPNPKNGTLVSDTKRAKSFSTGTLTLKTEKEAPLVHTVIGKVSQKDSEIVDNLEAILKAFGGSKQIVRAFVKSSMSPSVKVAI